MDTQKRLEAENITFTKQIYRTLNMLDADAVESLFHDDAATYDADDRFPPSEGKAAIGAFFRDFFERGRNIRFELLDEPQAAGNFVMVRQVDHFEWEGRQRHDRIVSVIYITDGKIRKWYGQILQP